MRARGLFMTAALLWSLVLLGTPCPGPASAETPAGEGSSPEPTAPAWKRSLVGGANFSQTSFSHWSQGGENFMTWTFSAQGALERVADPWNWKSTLELEYGFIRRGGEKTRKSVDQIILESIGTRKVSERMGVFVAAGLRTQFAKGKDYAQDPPPVTSAFADPLYLTQSAGLSRDLAPGLAARLGLALQEIRTDRHRQYSDDPETPELDDLKVEGGLTSVVSYDGALREGVHARSKLTLFYFLDQTDELDVDWNSALKIELTRHLSVDYNLQILYDEDVIPRAQVKQFLGLGISLAIW